MHLVRPVKSVCDDVRSQISLDLDGELSTFERRILDSHLKRCEACRAFQADVSDISTALRAAPLERPSEQIRIPSLRRFHVGVWQVLAPAAVAMIAAVAIVVNVGGSAQPGTAHLVPSIQPLLTAPNTDLIELRSERRAQLTSILHYLGGGPGGPQLPETIKS